jgi:hypothetical protein
MVRIVSGCEQIVTLSSTHPKVLSGLLSLLIDVVLLKTDSQTNFSSRSCLPFFFSSMMSSPSVESKRREGEESVICLMPSSGEECSQVSVKFTRRFQTPPNLLKVVAVLERS